MAQNMIGPNLDINYVDKRRLSLIGGASGSSRMVGITIFTANGVGTTTTIVGANAAPGTNDVNIIRRGEKFKLFTAAGALKEETVFRVTGVAVAASTTVTFIPAATVATASGDFCKRVGAELSDDLDDLDFRLNQFSSTTYPQTVLDQMTANDKIYALRNADDGNSLP